MNKVEIELGKCNRKFFLWVDLDTKQIKVDFKALPDTAFLCALCDGIALSQSKCGKNHNLIRTFVDIDWVINEWGGDEEIVKAVKKRKQMILDDLPRLREKYYINTLG